MRGKRKDKGQGDPEVAMAYLRRLHGDPSVTPDNAPVGDLAELAEREQTTDAGHEKTSETQAQ